MRLLFSLTLFLSAALLFMVQPMFAKMVLPRLGGTPAVWNTCMVFFQAALLAGYAYSHWLARLKPQRQALIHLLLLALPLAVLPIYISPQWLPPKESNPIPWMLLLLSTAVGLPFFAVATNAPLLQKWFSRTPDPAAQDPYFLYAASNIGSMLALLSYPVLVEPFLELPAQSKLWTAGYVLLLILVVICAAITWKNTLLPVTQSPSLPVLPETQRDRETGRQGDGVTGDRRLRWVALAFVPSSLMLGLTTYVTTDVASLPLLWIIPLAVYLASFILVFGRWPVAPERQRGEPEHAHRAAIRLFPFAMTALLIFLLAELWTANVQLTRPIILLNFAVFLVAALVCHGELARDRPSPRHLTEFFLWMSFGGVLGGIFNALLAPAIFDSAAEYPIALALACFLMPPTTDHRLTFADVRMALYLGGFFYIAKYLLNTEPSAPSQTTVLLVAGIIPALLCHALASRPRRYALGVSVLLCVTLLRPGMNVRTLRIERSFFGVSRVMAFGEGDVHVFFHGTTLHGEQNMRPNRSREPLSYYYSNGPAGQLFDCFSGEKAKKNVAVLGLGCGSLAAYAEAGQHYTFYEIDPGVRWIARDSGLFTYLIEADERGAHTDVIMGDARLSLQDAPPHAYDILAMDCFSSDAVPMHLMTREAVRLYMDKLAPHGLLLFNISNRYLQLESIVGSIAADAGLAGIVQLDTTITEDEQQLGKSPSHWIFLAREAADFDKLNDDPRWKMLRAKPGTPVWTDEFSNIISVIKWK